MNETTVHEMSILEQPTLSLPKFFRSDCFILTDSLYDKVMARHTSNLTTAVINGLCSPFAVIANSLVVLVITRNAYLQTPSNVLLGCLAFSDFLVGLLVQPCYVAFRLIENTNHFVPCGLRILYSQSFWIFYGVSFLTLSAISFERYTALRLHLRYKKVVTSECVLMVVVGIWLLDIFFNRSGMDHKRSIFGMSTLVCCFLAFS